MQDKLKLILNRNRSQENPVTREKNDSFVTGAEYALFAVVDWLRDRRNAKRDEAKRYEGDCYGVDADKAADILNELAQEIELVAEKIDY